MTTLGGITLCNYLRKYLGKTHAGLCRAMKTKDSEKEPPKEKEGRDYVIYPHSGQGARLRVYEAIIKALQMHPANLLTWKIKQRLHSVPLKTLRYMTAFVIIVGQSLN